MPVLGSMTVKLPIDIHILTNLSATGRENAQRGEWTCWLCNKRSKDVDHFAEWPCIDERVLTLIVGEDS